jgi:outer membrane autotransporter protein
MLGGSEINLYARASWAHYFSRDARFSGSLVGLAGSAFTVEGARPPRDAALLAIGSDMKLGTSIFIGGQFDTEQSATSRTYSGSAKLRVAF